MIDTRKHDESEQADKAFREIRGALENLVAEMRAACGVRNNLGLKVNVALNVAERALRTHPAPSDD